MNTKHTPGLELIHGAWYCAAILRECDEESFSVGDINRTHSLEDLYEYDAESGRFWTEDDGDVGPEHADIWVFQHLGKHAAKAAGEGA